MDRPTGSKKLPNNCIVPLAYQRVDVLIDQQFHLNLAELNAILIEGPMRPIDMALREVSSMLQ